MILTILTGFSLDGLLFIFSSNNSFSSLLFGTLVSSIFYDLLIIYMPKIINIIGNKD